MRLIETFSNEKDALTLSHYLQQKGITNQLDVQLNKDWGSADYGTPEFRLWVIEEDQFEQATGILHQFLENPDDSRYETIVTVEPPPPFVEPTQKTTNARATITLSTIILCCLLFFQSSIHSPQIKPPYPPVPLTPLLISPIEKALFYDYPKTYEIINQIVDLFGVEALRLPADLPAEGRFLVQQYNETPYWKGLYDVVIQKYDNPELPWNFSAPLFEKISQGEWWRVFTPIFLHADIFHLLFNMLWLYVLGIQLESRLSRGKFLFLIFLAAAVSNTAQYLMSGPNFLGFSGVLCAFLTFIWMRQRRAPWEGYQLDRSTWIFLLIFISVMAALGLLSFVIELYTDTHLAIGVANTAHLTGGLVGLLLGIIDRFGQANARSDSI